jgi:hypothetical protein
MMPIKIYEKFKCTIAGPQLGEFLSEGAFSKSLYRIGTGNHFYGTEYS